MSGFGFRVNFGGAVERLAAVCQGLAGGSLAREIAKFAEHRVFSDSQQSFVVQANPTTGERWKPSVRATKQEGQTLLDTGRLRRAVRVESFVHGDRITVRGGTLPLVYAAIHQFGGEAGRNHSVTLPARPYVGLRPQSLDAIGAQVQRIIARELSR